ncbi:hypothetical protein [Paracidovorax cattleyae]|uniref:hypothetical protein n=1 Tax=Paracidovorax cattleyae TaxID=80868 RepID=UPI0018AFDB87|nr:hypothetical protein [Paracidovorax cattleyae]MBF9264978.1 hypothetical protein [Paracidovorax cattleyae]
MLSFNLSSFTLPRPFSALSLLGDASGAARATAALALPRTREGTALVSAYEDPPADLDQRVRAVGEW